MRRALSAFILSAATAAVAQTSVSPSQQVQLLAPQLVPFAGSAGNFDSLVNGLATNVPVTLVSVGTDGSVQIVTFTPGTALSTGDTARLLESARQNLIVRGIPAPTGQQLAAALFGGNVTTPSGTAALTGVLTGTNISPTPVQVRTDTPAPGALPASNISAAQLQAVRNALATGTATTLVSGSGATAQSVVFAPNSGRLSDFEVNQTLQLAFALLAQQGIVNPTPDQLRAALFGGTVGASSGATVAIQGVLQGRVRNASDSASIATSTSPGVNTSASSVFGTSNTPPAATASTGSSPATPRTAGDSAAGRSGR